MTAERPGHQPERIGRATGPEARVWRRLVRKSLSGRPLSEPEQRAIRLRQAGISIANAVSTILENPRLLKDSIAHTKTLAQYYDGLVFFQEQGITPDTSMGRPEEDYQDPLVVAEMVAAQWVRKRRHEIPEARTALRHYQEMAERRPDCGNGEVGFISPEHITPFFRNWLKMKYFCNLTWRFLAADLDPNPTEHKRPEPHI